MYYMLTSIVDRSFLDLILEKGSIEGNELDDSTLFTDGNSLSKALIGIYLKAFILMAFSVLMFGLKEVICAVCNLSVIELLQVTNF